MSQEGSSWLMQQASASALRLVETPPALLDPVGRSLRELAIHRNDAPRELRVVPGEAVLARKSTRRSTKKEPSDEVAGAEKMRQPTLMNVIIVNPEEES